MPLLIWREVENANVPVPRRKFVAQVGELGWVHIEENLEDPAKWDVWTHVGRRNHKSKHLQPSVERAQLKAEQKGREMLGRMKKWIAAAEHQLGVVVGAPEREVVSR